MVKKIFCYSNDFAIKSIKNFLRFNTTFKLVLLVEAMKGGLDEKYKS